MAAAPSSWPMDVRSPILSFKLNCKNPRQTPISPRLSARIPLFSNIFLPIRLHLSPSRSRLTPLSLCLGARSQTDAPLAPSALYTFNQSAFGGTFTSFSLDPQVQEKYAETIKALKEEARSMLIAKGNTTSDKLLLIDTLERLGVAYHFEQEIKEQLEEIIKFDFKQDYDLFTTALRFRLLRQHRHYVSCSVFDKFTGKDNKFNETLSSDAKGLLSLYEAAYLRIHGEEILEEALAFTKHHLNRMVQQLECPLQDQVKRALQQPLHRGLPRMETRYYISFYEKDNSKNDLLLKLAKLDFNYVQNMYKKDICELSRWWKDVNPKLPYARDRFVEAYLWGTTFHFEPQYSHVRLAIAKATVLITVVDDTYDNFATVEEAHLFTEALERWNIDESDQLPEYLKILYKFVLTIYDEYKREATEEGKLFAIPYAKQTVIEICRAYNKSFKWFVGRETPSFEDYIVNLGIRSVLYVLCAWAIPSMKSVSKETIDWLMSQPKILMAAAKVCRYLDDVSGFERESKQGQFMTGLDFYMKQYGLSTRETADKFVELADDAWKDLNTEWILAKTTMPKDMLEKFLGYARGAEVFCRSAQDGYSKPEIVAPIVVALFVDPIMII